MPCMYSWYIYHWKQLGNCNTLRPSSLGTPQQRLLRMLAHSYTKMCISVKWCMSTATIFNGYNVAPGTDLGIKQGPS